MATYVNGNSVRVGYVIKYNKALYRVMVADHVTPGKGKAFMQVKLRNIFDGTQTGIRFRSDEKIERAVMEQIEMEYLYNDSSGYCFMNTTNYEQIYLDENVLGESTKFFLPNIKVFVEFHEGKPLGVQLPEAVEMKITETEPGLKGATAAGSGKPATLETGLVVTVPQFVEVGEMVRVSTTSGEYLERVKS